MKKGLTMRILALLCAFAVTFCSVLFPAAQKVFADPVEIVEETTGTQEEPVVQEKQEETAPAPAAQSQPEAQPADQPQQEVPPAAQTQEEPVQADDAQDEEPAAEPEQEEAVVQEEPEQEEVLPETEEPVQEEIQQEDEIRMPAQEFSRTYGGLRIVVRVSEGVLPEGADMQVSSAPEQIKAYAEDLYKEETADVLAVRIRFTDKDGQPVEPAGKLQVTVQVASPLEGASYAAFSLKGADTVRKVSAQISGAKLVFELDGASGFGVAALTGETEQEEEIPQEEPEETEIPEEEEEIVEEEAIEEETEEEEADPMTAKTFSGSAGGVSVYVQAPEGAFPEGTSMVLRPVSAASVISQIENQIDESVKNVQAVDISFRNAQGEEIEPLKPIRVSLGSSLITADTLIVHIDDNGGVDEVNASIKGASAAFHSDDFSVYAVVDTGSDARMLVKFMNGATEIASMYVKQGDNMEQVLYDPGAGSLADGVLFEGWVMDADYDVDDAAMSIADIRTAVSSQLAGGVTDGTTVTYYAKLVKQYNVTYLDAAGTSLGMTAMKIRADAAQTQLDYTVNQAYTPDAEENFYGWNVISGGSNIDGYTAGKVYPNGTQIKISGSVVFSVNTAEGHWLIFHENKTGATYNAPQFVKSGETTDESKVLEMTLKGYTFSGWYTDKDCTDGKEFTFGGTLIDTTHIYAKWTAATSAGYTILVWKQNVNDAKNAADANKTYDFAEAITVENGTVGQTIDVSSATDKDYEGFKLNTSKTQYNVTITPEGNAVANVYYDRELITLTFQYRSGNSWATQATMTGLYGQTLAQNGYSWPTNRWWYDNYTYSGGPGGGYQGSGMRMTLLTDFILPGGATSQTFYGFAGNGNNHVYFYQQNANGNGYTLADQATTGNGTFNISDKYSGFKAAYYSTNNTNWTQLGDKDSNGYYAAVSNYSNLYIRYDRVTYSLLYQDGVYVDRNNISVEGYSSRGELKVVENIPYGADVSSYNKGGANAYTPTFSGFTFDGWYVDEACTQPYTFTTMPEGITVYAKWVQNYYRVFLRPNAGTDTTLDWGSDSQATAFLIANGASISTPDGRREEYEFVGWFLADGTYFNEDAFVASAAIAGSYDKTESTELDKWGNPTEATNKDVNRDWVVGKIELFGKWRSKLTGAKGIGIVYDATSEGTNAPTDTTLYVDTAKAIAGAASTPNDSTKKFEYWVVQTWNGTAFEDTDKIVYPGEDFDVLKANARVVENEGSTAEEPSFTYTVQLKAVYGPKDAPTPTHIYWYDNNGSDAFRKDNNVAINQALGIPTARTRDGYRFLGWARVSIGTTTEAAEAWEANSSNWTQDLAESDLYLYYKDADGTYHLTSTSGKAVTQVAADEDIPYHAMFAVWEKLPEVQIKITGNTDTKTYNGQEQSVTGYTVQYRIGDEDWSATAPDGVTVTLKSGQAAEAKGTDVDTYPMGLTEASFDISTGSEYVLAEDGVTVEDGSLEITPLAVTVTITGNTDSKVYSGSEQQVEDYEVSINNALYTEDDFTFNGEAVAKGTDVGTYPMGLEEGQFTNTNDNFEVTFDVTDGSLEITPVTDKVTVTITGNSDSKVYSGSEQQVEDYEVSIDNALYTEDDFTFSGEAIAKGTNVGTYEMGLTEDQFTNTNANFSNVEFVVEDGSLEITPLSVTVVITGNSDTKTYSGSEQQVEGYEVQIGNPKYTEDDFTFSGEAVAKGTDVGTYPMGLEEDQFENNNGNFEVTFSVTDGSLTITDNKDEVIVTITGKTDSKVYSGSEQQVEDYEVSISGSDLYTEDDFTFSGEAIAKGTNVGTYEMGLTEDQFTNTNSNFTNVTFVVTDGSLEITPLEVTVTITGNTDTKVYNGSEQQVEDYEVSISDSLYTEDDFTFSGEAVVKGTDVGTYPMGLEEDQFENNNANFEVTFSVTDGSLEITPVTAEVTVTITGKTDSKVYSGSEQQVEDYEVSISGSDLYTEDDFTFSGEAVAKGTNVGTYEMGLTEDQFTNTNANFTNVTFVVEDGSLEITPLEVTVTITGNSDSKNYTGEEQTVEGYEVSISDSLYTEDDFTFSGEAVAKGTDVGTYPMGLAEEQFENNNENFEVTFSVTDGSLEIKKGKDNDVEPTPDPDDDQESMDAQSKTITVMYDGKQHTVSGTATKEGSTIFYSTDNGETWSEEAPKLTDAGSIMFDIKAENPNYEDVVKTGYKLEVTKRSVVLTSADDSKVYDGTALTNEEVTAGGNGFAAGEGASYDVTGTIVNVGTEDNVFTYELNANTKASNYDITTEYGTLKITPAKVTVTAQAAGKAQGENDPELTVAITGLVNGESEDLVSYQIARAAGEEPGTYAITVSGSAQQGNYEVTFVNAVFTITGPEEEPEPEPIPTPPTPPVPPEPPVEPEEPVVIEDPPVPQSGAGKYTPPAEPEVIEADPVPKAPAVQENYWALINLLSTIVTGLISIVLLILFFTGKKKDDEDEDEETVRAEEETDEEDGKLKRKGIFRLLSLVPAIGAVVAFILTEDMRNPMRLVDKWTILMLVILAVNVVLMILSKKKREKTDEEQEEA